MHEHRPHAEPFLHRRTTLVFLLPFILYLSTLAPTVYNLDSAELTTAAATGGIVRASGYPLYLLLGWLWSKLSPGAAGFRLNLCSTFCGAVTLLLADLSRRRSGLSPRACWSERTFVWLGVMIAFGSGLLMSQRRYLWVLLPAFALLARWGERPWVDRLVTTLSLLGLGLFTALFANAYWVG